MVSDASKVLKEMAGGNRKSKKSKKLKKSVAKCVSCGNTRYAFLKDQLFCLRILLFYSFFLSLFFTISIL